MGVLGVMRIVMADGATGWAVAVMAMVAIGLRVVISGRDHWSAGAVAPEVTVSTAVEAAAVTVSEVEAGAAVRRAGPGRLVRGPPSIATFSTGRMILVAVVVRWPRVLVAWVPQQHQSWRGFGRWGAPR